MLGYVVQVRIPAELALLECGARKQARLRNSRAKLETRTTSGLRKGLGFRAPGGSRKEQTWEFPKVGDPNIVP